MKCNKLPQNKHPAGSIKLFLTSNTYSNHSHILSKAMTQAQRFTFAICFEIVGPPLKKNTSWHFLRLRLLVRGET